MTTNRKKLLLMVAFDFPPCHSAGVQRTLKFCEYLPEHNWQPIVLSAKSFIYNKIDADVKIPSWLEKNTYRAFGLNAFKHFSIKGKYFASTALPDPYSTWYWHSVFLGKRILKKHRPDIIWSTHPCLTALKIGYKLKKISGLPWVVDFRDPFKGHHSSNKNIRGEKIDADAINNADLLIFATNKMAELYKSRYPAVASEKFIVIENGYNEEIFTRLDASKENKHKVDAAATKVFSFLHSGEIYENGRDPAALYDAIMKYNQSAINNNRSIEVVFRGATFNASIKEKIISKGIDGNVQYLPSIDYVQSIVEMMGCDALIVLQGEIFNNQIPGKVYEYLRSKKPILALVDKKGATADLLKDVSHALTVDIKNADEIYNALITIQSLAIDKSFNYEKYSRSERCKQFAINLDNLLEKCKLNSELHS